MVPAVQFNPVPVELIALKEGTNVVKLEPAVPEFPSIDNKLVPD